MKNQLKGFISILFLAACFNEGSVVPGEEELISLGFRPIENKSQVPDILLADMDGNTQLMSEHRGRVVLLNFWASWCPPCRAEIPDFNILVNKLKGNEFSMIAVSVGEDLQTVTSFVETYNVEFPVFMDESSEIAQEMGVMNLPTTVLIDRYGQGIAFVVGALEWGSDEILQMMEKWTRR